MKGKVLPLLDVLLLLLLLLTSCSNMEQGATEESPISVKINGEEHRFRTIKIWKNGNDWDFYTFMYKVGDTVEVIDNSHAIINVQRK